MHGVFIVGLLALGVAVNAARGDAWTNAAGHVMEARLVRLDGNLAVFTLADGTRMDIPLNSLSAGARAKAENEQGRFRVPEPARPDYDHCVRTLKRLRSLSDAKRLGADDFAARRRASLGVLEDACLRLKTNGEITAEDTDRILSLAGSH